MSPIVIGGVVLQLFAFVVLVRILRVMKLAREGVVSPMSEGDMQFTTELPSPLHETALRLLEEWNNRGREASYNWIDITPRTAPVMWSLCLAFAKEMYATEKQLQAVLERSSLGSAQTFADMVAGKAQDHAARAEKERVAVGVIQAIAKDIEANYQILVWDAKQLEKRWKMLAPRIVDNRKLRCKTCGVEQESYVHFDPRIVEWECQKCLDAAMAQAAMKLANIENVKAFAPHTLCSHCGITNQPMTMIDAQTWLCGTCTEARNIKEADTGQIKCASCKQHAEGLARSGNEDWLCQACRDYQESKRPKSIEERLAEAKAKDPNECTCHILTTNWHHAEKGALCGHLKECPRFPDNFKETK